MEASEQPAFRIAHVFLDAAEFSHSVEPLSLPPNTPARVGDVDVKVEIGENQEGTAGVVRLTVSTNPKNEPIYKFLVRMVCIFEANDPAKGQIGEFLRSASPPALLYPFLREAVANITARGRFGPILLNPYRFTPMVSPSVSSSLSQDSAKKKTSVRTRRPRR